MDNNFSDSFGVIDIILIHYLISTKSINEHPYGVCFVFVFLHAQKMHFVPKLANFFSSRSIVLYRYVSDAVQQQNDQIVNLFFVTMATLSLEPCKMKVTQKKEIMARRFWVINQCKSISSRKPTCRNLHLREVVSC